MYVCASDKSREDRVDDPIIRVVSSSAIGTDGKMGVVRAQDQARHVRTHALYGIFGHIRVRTRWKDKREGEKECDKMAKRGIYGIANRE